MRGLDRWRLQRYVLVRLYLGWWVAAAFLFATDLIAFPQRLVDGPSTAAVYELMAPPWWGLAFLSMAALCAYGCARPLEAWRFAILALGIAQIAWALGLAVPIVQHWNEPDYHGNVLAPTAWVVLAVTTGIIGFWTNREERRPSGQG